ncbi:MAG: DNA polymerase IV [Candidatus Paceibacterota bacterium]
MRPFSSQRYPRAVLHVDGDSFFAQCEVARNPSLKGRPVVTGSERGIASALTYEAKARGVKRGMPIQQIKKICPDVVVLPSDYESYSLYSLRMYSIVRRYTPQVEEYSIDECFADLTGLRRPLGMSYERMAESIKRDLITELGLTFSVGLAPSKVLAKVASKWRKPNGLTFVPLAQAHLFLKKLSIEDVWGIGSQTSAFLKKHGIETAYHLATADSDWVKRNLSKPYLEIRRELLGEVVFEVDHKAKTEYRSISKTKTFTPPSDERSFVLSHLSKNIENACIKARRYGLAAEKIYFYLKTQDFKTTGLEIKISRAVATPEIIIAQVERVFDRVYQKGVFYRATGVVLEKLCEESVIQPDLFGASVSAEKTKVIYSHIDKLQSKYGKHVVFLGSSALALKSRSGKEKGSALKKLGASRFKGESKRRRIGIPFLGEAS